MTSCYKFEPLPSRIKSTHELAIAIIDTTVSIGNFVTFTLPEELLDTIMIPEQTPIDMGELEYPFFIGDYSPSQTIEWIDPFLILETKDLPSGTIVKIEIYIKDGNDRKIYFWLPENNAVTIAGAPVRIPDKPTSPLTNLESFRYATSIFFNISVQYPAATPIGKVINDRLNIKLGIKFKIETDLAI
jgi:hypothetical protein